MTSEQEVIGSLLLDDSAIEKVADFLEPQMFEDSVCGMIYADFLQGYQTRKAVNFYSIQEHYKDRPEVSIALQDCLDVVPYSVKLKDAAKLVERAYRARLLSDTMGKLVPNAENIDDILGKLQVLIDDLQSQDNLSCHTLGEITKHYKDDYFKEHEVIQFGFKGIDNLLKKLDRGDVTVIGARPSVGKSALSAQMGMKFSEQGYKVGYFVLEMAEAQIYERYVAMTSGIKMERIRQAKDFLNDEREKFDNANASLEKSDLMIITNCTTVAEMRKVTKAFKFDIVIVDYLQLVKAKKTYAGQRVNEVSEVSADFKRLAMELRCHVVLLSQLNRKTEEKKRPTMAELRESGSIEQDASNILLMWHLKTEGERGLVIAKSRHGKLGGMVLEFHGDTMTFVETDKDLEEEEKYETARGGPFK